MDFLNKAFAQVSDVFRSMTPAARITSGLLVIGIVVSLGFLFQQQSSSADYYLFGGEVLSQSEIDLIVSAFAKAQLNDWDVVGQRIRVPPSQKYAYVAAIADEEAYPETPSSAWQRMFTDDNPFKSKHMRELEALRAQEKSLARTIEQMKGIEVAIVQIDDVETQSFPRAKEKRASVSVAATANKATSTKIVESIRTMVANGGGMEPHNVTVVDLNTGDNHEGRDENGPIVDNLYAKYQRQYEDNLKEKIQDRLSTYSGITVAVQATLDDQIVNRTNKVEYDAKPTTLELSERSKETTSTTPGPQGRVGVVPNAAISNTAQEVAAGPPAESTTTERREDQKSVAGVTHSVMETVPFKPTWMTVSIGIPRTHFRDVWKQRNPPQPGQDPATPDDAALKLIESEVISEIENSVNPLLPKVAQGEDPFPRVSVVPYDHIPLEIPEGPSTADTALYWLSSNWQTLGMFGMAILGVIVLRSMVRAANTEERPAEQLLPAERLADLGQEPEGGTNELDAVNSLKARFNTSSRSLRDELTELVREDPGAAASVLQIWIGNVA